MRVTCEYYYKQLSMGGGGGGGGTILSFFSAVSRGGLWQKVVRL